MQGLSLTLGVMIAMCASIGVAQQAPATGPDDVAGHQLYIADAAGVIPDTQTKAEETDAASGLGFATSKPGPSASQVMASLRPSSAVSAATWTGGRERTSAGTLYRWSVIALVAANVADASSSWKSGEANPLVAGPGTQFGVTSLAIKSGFVGVSLLMQHLVLSHHPSAAKRLAWMNFATSGFLGGVSAHNMTLR